jgi:DNA-directed RNA polymerase subunit RPC12/RpoP
MKGEGYMDEVACANCKALVPDDSALSDDERTPCPHCGSKGRVHAVRYTSTVGVGGSFSFKVISYPDRLLETAKRLFDSSDYSIAVVVAHMACEVAVERALSRAFGAKGIADLEGAVTGLMNGYNLGNDRHCELFVALTRKAIKSEPFWAKFKESAARRNKAIHDGKVATEQEAEESLKAAAAFVAYLQ